MGHVRPEFRDANIWVREKTGGWRHTGATISFPGKRISPGMRLIGGLLPPDGIEGSGAPRGRWSENSHDATKSNSGN